MGITNSCILYKKYSGQSKSVYDFRLTLLVSLLPQVIPKAILTWYELRKIHKTTENIKQETKQLGR